MTHASAERLVAVTIHALRQVKLFFFVAKKRAGWKWHMMWVRPADPVWRLYQRIRPYSYDPKRYEDTFLVHDAPLDVDHAAPVPRRIFAVWTGPNDLTANRRTALRSIRENNPDIEVVVVTERSLSDWLVPGHPLHPAYEHLSLNHRSDHLRAYLLHHHGGGYCDVKSIRGPWRSAFERLEQSRAWLLGYTELRFDMVAKLPGDLGHDLVHASTQVLGCGSFIARARTPFTQELLDEQYRRMDAYSAELATNPGGDRGETPGYPVPWLGLMGSIVGPLCLKHQEHIIHDETVKVVFENYR